MDGRFFDTRIVEAYIADGSEKFKKTGEKKIGVGNDDDEDDDEGKRLDEFGSWLESEGKNQNVDEKHNGGDVETVSSAQAKNNNLLI